MKDLFKQIILDFHEAALPMPYKRRIIVPRLPETVRKAFVFTGMRRAGKTWSLFQVMRDLMAAGVPKERILYVNFEDERLLPLETGQLNILIEAYHELYPRNADSTVYFFFDEIHEIKGWELFVRRLLDTQNVRIFITGSSAKMLGREIATSLRGRTIMIEVFPFSFPEYLNCREKNVRMPLSGRKRALAAHHLSDFLVYGGFPESVVVEKSMHHKLLQSYVDTVIYRDIVERHGITNLLPLKDLIRFSLQNAASLMSINKLYHSFKSMGREIGKNSLYDYYGFLEDAYCIFLVPLFSHSQRQQAVNLRKIYAVDQGLISAYSVKPSFDRAARLENAVFSDARRQGHTLFYYRTRTGKEVDFVVQRPNGGFDLLQVCESMKDEKTRAREKSALQEAMRELDKKRGVIITLDDREVIKENKTEIRVLPVIDWLLRKESETPLLF